MDGVTIADVRVAAEQAQGARRTRPPRFLLAVLDPHVVTRHGLVGQHLLELHRADRLEALVGVEDQHPVAAGLVQRRVAGGGEVVAPGDVDHAGAVALGDQTGVVLGSGVGDDDLVDDRQRRLDGLADPGLLVARDDAQSGGLSLHMLPHPVA